MSQAFKTALQREIYLKYNASVYIPNKDILEQLGITWQRYNELISGRQKLSFPEAIRFAEIFELSILRICDETEISRPYRKPHAFNKSVFQSKIIQQVNKKQCIIPSSI